MSASTAENTKMACALVSLVTGFASSLWYHVVTAVFRAIASRPPPHLEELRGVVVSACTQRERFLIAVLGGNGKCRQAQASAGFAL